MKTKIFLLVYILAGCLFAQSTMWDKDEINAFYGIGNNHLLDEYISKNEYSGVSSLGGIYWLHTNAKNQTRVGFIYSTASNLENLNNRAATYDFQMDYQHLYSICKTTLFDKPLNLYLGPDFGFYLHYRNQKIAASLALSVAALFSANAAMNAECRLSDKFSVSGNLLLSALSFTVRTPSLEDTNNIPTPVALLPIPNVLNLNAGLFTTYNINGWINLQCGYRFVFMKISKWDYFRQLNDNLIFQCGVNL